MDKTATIRIRHAVIDDFIAIYLLNLYCLAYDYPPERTKKRLAHILLNPNAMLLVAETGGHVIGYIHAVDYDCTYYDSLKSILSLAVEEDYRGQGVGRALVTAIEKWAAVEGSVGVRLVTSAYRNEAHKFYEACGYKLRKEQKNYIKFFRQNAEGGK